MTQDSRELIKQHWFKDCTTMREIGMPSEAKFFVGQTIVYEDDDYEVVGYYDYHGTLPGYLCFQWTSNTLGIPTGLPLTIQSEMYLKSEEHLHRKAKIINIFEYERKY